MSEGVGELLFTFAYLSILTGRIHGWKLWSCCSDGLIVEGPSQVSTKARPTHSECVWAMGLGGKQQRYRRGEFLMESGGTLVFVVAMWG